MTSDRLFRAVLCVAAFIVLTALSPQAQAAEPLKVFILAGQSNMVGHGKVEMGREPGTYVEGESAVEVVGGLGSLRRMVNENPAQFGDGGLSGTSAQAQPFLNQPAHDGNQVAFIQAPSNISQSISGFDPSKLYTVTYSLSFEAAGREITGSTAFEVLLDGVALEFAGSTVIYQAAADTAGCQDCGPSRGGRPADDAWPGHCHPAAHAMAWASHRRRSARSRKDTAGHETPNSSAISVCRQPSSFISTIRWSR